MEGALGQGKMLRKRQKSAQPQDPAVPASWTAGDLKKRSSGDTQVVPAMDMPLASCTGGDLTQPPSGDAQVVQAIGMQLGALAQATELLADAAIASATTRKPHNKRKRRNRPRKRGSGMFKKIKKATMAADAAMAVEAAMAAVVQGQAATSEDESHHMRRCDRRRKRGSGKCKNAKKAALAEAGQALPLIP